MSSKFVFNVLEFIPALDHHLWSDCKSPSDQQHGPSDFELLAMDASSTKHSTLLTEMVAERGWLQVQKSTSTTPEFRRPWIQQGDFKMRLESRISEDWMAILG